MATKQDIQNKMDEAHKVRRELRDMMDELAFETPDLTGRELHTISQAMQNLHNALNSLRAYQNDMITRIDKMNARANAEMETK